MKKILIVWLSVLVGGLALRGAEGESLVDRTVRQLAEKQRNLLADAAKAGDRFDRESFQRQIQEISSGYEALLRDNPDYAPGYAAYGFLLGKVGMKKESITMLLKANDLDPDQAIVKNQIGNFIAEEGRPLDALPYYVAAIKLEPKEPLYHYQLGKLLHEARDDFVKSGEWTATAIARASHEAFGHAAELAPDRIEFTYRYAESFYDLAEPDWPGALKAWAELEAKAQTPVERDTMRLHEANVLIKQAKPAEARAMLEKVTEFSLQEQKEKLVAQLASAPVK